MQSYGKEIRSAITVTLLLQKAQRVKLLQHLQKTALPLKTQRIR